MCPFGLHAVRPLRTFPAVFVTSNDTCERKNVTRRRQASGQELSDRVGQAAQGRGGCRSRQYSGAPTISRLGILRRNGLAAHSYLEIHDLQLALRPVIALTIPRS